MTGLTAFICKMIRTPMADLTRANRAKLAAKYDIPVEWADFYLSAWTGR